MSRRPKSTRDLSPLERRFVAAMNDLGFGRFEHLRIARGELVLDPWPTSVRTVKFGSAHAAPLRPSPDDFDLKSEIAALFEYVRAVDEGEIRCLELRHGYPFLMEVKHPLEAR